MSGMFEGASQLKRIYRISSIILAVVGFSYGALSGYFYLTSSHAARRAEIELRRGQVVSARNRLDWVLCFHPHNARANMVLGKIELASGATEEAIACFRIIPTDSSFHQMASIQLAKALALDGQITAAEAELKQYLQRYEPTESVWDLYFRLLYLQTRTRDVISLFE